MNTTADTVIRHFFDETGMEQVSLDSLQQFVEDYPYVAAGHLLLAKKLREHGEDDAEYSATAATIYMNNPLLLDPILNPVANNRSGNFELRAKQLEESIAKQQSNLTDTTFDIPEHDLTETERSYFGYGSNPGREAVSEVHSSGETVAEETTTATSEYHHEPITEVKESTQQSSEPSIEYEEKAESVNTENEPVTYAFAPENYGVSTGHHVEQNEFEIAQAEKISTATENQEEAFDPQFHELPIGDEPAAETAEVVDIPTASFEQHEIAGRTSDESNEAITDEPDFGEEESFDSLESESSEQPFELGEVLDADKLKGGPVGEIKLEPYYTVDYFASQGIRLQTGDLGKDNIGKQLRSFTDWLRSMKKLPSPTDSPADEAVQQSILRIAAHSIEEKEVITETMAEVWAKQGNVQRATDIYNKLSLQNPSKSHYFAAKIEQLKSL